MVLKGMYLPTGGGSHHQNVTSFNTSVGFYRPEATIDVLGRRQVIIESKKAFSVIGVAVLTSSSFLTTLACDGGVA